LIAFENGKFIGFHRYSGLLKRDTGIFNLYGFLKTHLGCKFAILVERSNLLIRLIEILSQLASQIFNDRISKIASCRGIYMEGMPCSIKIAVQYVEIDYLKDSL
jgi:hypothetical protein